MARHPESALAEPRLWLAASRWPLDLSSLEAALDLPLLDWPLDLLPLDWPLDLLPLDWPPRESPESLDDEGLPGGCADARLGDRAAALPRLVPRLSAAVSPLRAALPLLLAPEPDPPWVALSPSGR